MTGTEDDTTRGVKAPSFAKKKRLGPEDFVSFQTMLARPRRQGEKRRLEQNPCAVFILSPPRSGSTLLRLMLAGHPGLFSPPGMQLLSFWTLGERRKLLLGELADIDKNVLSTIAELRSCSRDEAKVFFEKMEEQNMVILEFMARLQEWTGGRLLVDKSTTYALEDHTLRRLEKDFDDPLYIHLTRHPAASVDSFVEQDFQEFFPREQQSFDPPELAELIWGSSHQNILEFLQEIPAKRCFRLSFEELLEGPEEMMRRLCAFLKLPFHQGLLNPYQDREKKMLESIREDPKIGSYKGLDPDVAQRWKKAKSLEHISDTSWRIAEILGYRPPVDVKQRFRARQIPLLNLPFKERKEDEMEGDLGFREASCSLGLDEGVRACILALQKETGIPGPVLVLTAFATLLHGYTGQEEMTLGWLSPGGLYPLRCFPSQNSSFSKLAQEIWQEIQEAQPDQTGVLGSSGQNQGFQVLFGHEDSPLSSLEQARGFELCLRFTETGDPGGETALALSMKYNVRRFRENIIRGMGRHLSNLLTAAAKKPGKELHKLPLLGPKERQQILEEWNDTTAPFPDATCIHHLFEKKVAKAPERIALEFQGEQLNYEELNRRANQLANYLIKQEVGPETVVALCMERSLETVITIIAIVKAGGAYLPLSPTEAPERLAFMLEESEAPVLLSQTKFSEKLSFFRRRLLFLDQLQEEMTLESVENPGRRAGPRNLSYLIYTSGSTGQPKGVLIEHQALCNQISVLIPIYGYGPGVRVLHIWPFLFDAATAMLWKGLCSGATLSLAPLELLGDSEKLAHYLKVEHINLAAFTPSGLAALPFQEFPELATILTGAEELPRELVARWAPGRTFFNVYGPTEATMIATTGTCQDDGETPSIGRSIPNNTAYVLDRNLNPLPVGVRGELYLGGVALARGYLKDPVRTSRSFVSDPFSGKSGARLYRTGDICSFHPGGTLDFHGRVDEQVKVRGFRIELGEIEAALVSHPAVEQVVVVEKIPAFGNKQLVAYFTSREQGPSNLREFREFLARKLPDYMIPSYFIEMESFPLSPSGKLDKKQLPLPAREEGKDFIKPRNRKEQFISRIWQEALGVLPGALDNFFDLGGDSLKAVSILSTIEESYHCKITMADFMKEPTVAGLATQVDREKLLESVEQLIILREEGNKTPIFMVAPTMEAALSLANLARHLGSEQPFFVLQPEGKMGTVTTTREFYTRDTAKRLVDRVQEIYPKGPYILGGRCIGGVIMGLEIAQFLKAQGKEVPFFVALDAMPPPSASRQIDSFAKRHPKLWFRFQRLFYRLEQRRPVGPIFLRFKKGLRWFMKRFLSLESSKNLRKVLSGQLSPYRAMPFQDRIIAFRATSHPPEEIEAARDGWESLVVGGLRWHVVSGTHSSILQEPHVGVLVSFLKEDLELQN